MTLGVDTEKYCRVKADKRYAADISFLGKLYRSKLPKINLSSSFRAARSAISLRALDILGCGGFLLSNAQPELEECFRDREEVVLFRSIDEAIELADYYLALRG